MDFGSNDLRLLVELCQFILPIRILFLIRAKIFHDDLNFQLNYTYPKGQLFHLYQMLLKYLEHKIYIIHRYIKWCQDIEPIANYESLV
jgi:hypothetical protein